MKNKNNITDYSFRYISLLHILLQLAGVVTLLWVTFTIINGIRFGWDHPWTNGGITTALILAAALVEYATRHREIAFIGGLPKHQLDEISQRQVLFTLVFIFGSMVMLKDDGLSRAFLLMFFGLYYLWIRWSNRFGFRMLIRFYYLNRSRKTKTGTRTAFKKIFTS